MKVIACQAAAKAGKSRYFTGVPCKHGHVSERRVHNADCIACENMRRVRRRARMPEHERERQRAKQRRNYPAYRVTRGLPAPTRPEPPVCENCDKAPSGRWKRLALDHCHETGKFRGWLCSPCNLSIGQLGDTVLALERATAYLRRAE